MNKVSSSLAVAAAISRLKDDWPKLSVIDQARSIASLKRSGVPVREIGRLIGKSDSLLRHILLGLEANAADRALAHQGKITTNDLVRRAKAAAGRRAATRSEALVRDRQRQALHGANLICNWLRENELTGPYGEQIIEEARTIMMLAELGGNLPTVDPPEHPVAPTVIIERCKPQEPLDDTMTVIAWFGKWLARWAVFAITDPDAREKALNLAHDRQ